MKSKAEILEMLEGDGPDARALVRALVASGASGVDTDIQAAARKLADRMLAAQPKGRRR